MASTKKRKRTQDEDVIPTKKVAPKITPTIPQPANLEKKKITIVLTRAYLETVKTKKANT